MKRFILMLVLLLCFEKMLGQVNGNNNSSLFVHFDKNVYINTENVWFTAYILQTEAKLNQHNILYVSVVSHKDSTVVLQEKFIIQNGFSFGSFNLPDSLSSGNYSFVVNTNIKLNNQPELCFIQPFLLKSTFVDPLVITIEQNEKNIKEGNILIKAIGKKYYFVEKVKISYVIGDKDKPVAKGVGYTNTIGEALIKYPVNSIVSGNNILKIVAVKEKLTRYANFEIRKNNSEKKRVLDSENAKKLENISIKFYPEGGYLIEDLVSTVGIEARKNDNILLKTKIALYKDNIPFDTLVTNSSGMGKFKFKPLPNSIYTAKIIEEEGTENKYNLPEALKQGCALTAPSLSKNSIINIQLQTKGINSVNILLQQKDKVLTQVRGLLKENIINTITLDLSKIPIGLTVLTVLDSANRPLAEKLFFAHQDKLNNATIELDREEFKVRDSVSIKIKASDFSSKLLNGNISLASVSSRVLLNINKINILDYTYIDKYFSQLPIDYIVSKTKDSAYLADLFLIKYWRKYKWNENDLAREKFISEIKYSGQVLKYDKKVKIPEMAMLYNGKILRNVIKTDSNGMFNLDYKSIIITPGNSYFKLYTMYERDIYSFKFSDPFLEVKDWIAKLKLKSNSYESLVINTGEDKMNNQNKAIKLKDVNITNGDFIVGCSDFVCPYNILNCVNHVWGANNTRAIIGETYLLKSMSKETILYKECLGLNRDYGDIIGINPVKEYYKWNISDLNEPINFSTIYWNYQVKLNDKEPTSLKFYTGDITGDFKIIVQGITENGVVYGEKEFTVVK